MANKMEVKHSKDRRDVSIVMPICPECKEEANGRGIRSCDYRANRPVNYCIQFYCPNQHNFWRYEQLPWESVDG